MPFPVLGVLALPVVKLIGSMLVGAGAGVAISSTATGVSNLNQAQTIADNAEYKYRGSRSLLESEVKRTSELAENYGETQISAYNAINQVFSTILLNPKILEKLELTREKIASYQAISMDSAEIFDVGRKAVTRAATSVLLSALGRGVQTIGIENTVKTIGLYGFKAGASKLLLASASTMTSGLVIPILMVPAFISMGFKFCGETEEMLTEAYSYSVKVDNEVARINTFRQNLPYVDQRIKELIDVVGCLTKNVNEQFNKFNALSPERQARAAKNLDGFWWSILLILQFFLYNFFRIGHNPEETRRDKSDLDILVLLASDLAKILEEASVLDEDGRLKKDSVLVEKYRHLYCQL